MVKMYLLVVAFLILALTGCGRAISHIDWIDFIQFNGIQYIAVGQFGGTTGRDLVETDLGPEFAQVKFKHAEEHLFGHQCCRDGDAAYLDTGTPVYIVNGFKPEFRLAAYRDGRLILYEADTNPNAQTGADLLDIGSKVLSIGVISGEDGVTELATITDPKQVAALVDLVIRSPVDQNHQSQGITQYLIAFYLEDGTIVTRFYWPDSGELSRGIMLPEAFRTAVEQAFLTVTPTPP